MWHIFSRFNLVLMIVNSWLHKSVLQAFSSQMVEIFNTFEISTNLALIGNVIGIVTGIMGAFLYGKLFLHHPKQYYGIFFIYSSSVLLALVNIYNLKNGISPYIVISVEALGTFFFMPFMGMVFEELISRLNPRYLLAISVILQMGTQAMNFLTTFVFGLLFKNPS